VASPAIKEVQVRKVIEQKKVKRRPVYLAADLHNRLRAQKSAAGCSLTWIVTHAVEMYLERLAESKRHK
jgi:hypothetical protein